MKEKGVGANATHGSSATAINQEVSNNLFPTQVRNNMLQILSPSKISQIHYVFPKYFTVHLTKFGYQRSDLHLPNICWTIWKNNGRLFIFLCPASSFDLLLTADIK